MLEKAISRLTKILKTPLSTSHSAPFWRKQGPTWYLASWWPCETLSSMQYSLIGLLAVAHSERLDPKPLIDALASEHHGRYRRRLKLLAKRLDSNTSLIAALEKTPDVLSESAVLAIRFGGQSGTLSQTYAQLIETEQHFMDVTKSSQREAKSYFVMMALVVMILLPLMFLIVPTLLRLMAEFELNSVPLSNLRMCWEVLTKNFLWCVLGLSAFIFLVRSTRSKQFFRRQVADRLFHSNSLFRSAQLLRMLATNVAAGRPLAGSLSTLAKYHFDSKVRQRLLLARNEVEQGVPAWSSLVDAQLISGSEFDALNSANDSRVQAWMLNRLANVKQENANQRLSMQSAFLHPLSVLLVASVVLWICYSFFSVLTNLIEIIAA